MSQVYQVAPGIYDSPEVISHRVTASMVKGTPCVEVTFRIHYADGGTGDVMAQLWMSDGAIERTFDALEHLGWYGQDITELGQGNLVLSGTDVSIDVRAETYKEQTRVRVAFVNRLGGSGGDIDADAINARLLARRRSQAPQAQPPAQSQPAAPPVQQPAPAQQPAPPAAPGTPPQGRPLPAPPPPPSAAPGTPDGMPF